MNPKCKSIPADMWYPKNSIEMEIKVFRLVKSKSQITPNDFLASYDEDKKLGRIRNKMCNNDEYYAVSLFKDIDDARALPNKVPCKQFKGIAEGKTLTQDGRIRSNPYNSHISWWLYDDATPETYFNICEEVEEVER